MDGPRYGIQVPEWWLVKPVHAADEVEAVVAAVTCGPGGSLIVMADAFNAASRELIIALAARYPPPGNVSSVALNPPSGGDCLQLTKLIGLRPAVAMEGSLPLGSARQARVKGGLAGVLRGGDISGRREQGLAKLALANKADRDGAEFKTGLANGQGPSPETH